MLFLSLPHPLPLLRRKKERSIIFYPKRDLVFFIGLTCFLGHYYSYQAEAVCIHGLNYDNQLVGFLGARVLRKYVGVERVRRGQGGEGPPKTRKEETLLPFFIFILFFLPDLFKRSSTWM